MQKQSAIFITLLCTSFVSEAQNALSYEQQLGKLLYTDKNLSSNKNQSCATCHSLTPVQDEIYDTNAPPVFVDPQNIKKGTPVSLGSIPFATGTLNAPSVGYAAFSPLFHWDQQEGLYVGGQFWNGRAKDLTEQAKKPFLNPVEMAMPSEWAVVSRLKENNDYKRLFWQIYKLDLNAIPHIKDGLFNEKPTEAVSVIYRHMAKAIGEFEKSHVFNKFNSKFDYVLAGMTHLSPIEQKGLDLFNDKANCAACHTSEAGIAEDGSILPPLFTDFTYDNIGLPRNVKIPNNPKPDLGLGGRLAIKKQDPNGNEIGKHKVMSLRNIALTPPYGHNGVLKTLKQVVHFYNTRDTLKTLPDNESKGFAITGWPAPEILQNVNHDELGDLGLTDDEEKAVVAFLKTLTDDYPKWGNDSLVPPGTPSPFPQAMLP